MIGMNLRLILKALAKPEPRSAADLRSDLAAIDLPALEGAVSTLEQQRKELLLKGSDADLAENNAAIVAANLEAERAQAAAVELQRLIVEAEAREASEALDAQYAAAEEAAAIAGKAAREIDELAGKLTARLSEITRASASVTRWNALAEKAGQHGRRLACPTVATVRNGLMRAIR